MFHLDLANYLKRFHLDPALNKVMSCVFLSGSAMKHLKCYYCTYKEEPTFIVHFIDHFKTHHPSEVLRILKPVVKDANWKYTCMNYGVNISELGPAELSFSDDMSLIKDVDTPDIQSPAAKRLRLI